MYICARVNGFRFHKKITLLYTTYLSANYHPNRSMDFSMKSLANFFWVCMFNPHFMLRKFGCFWHWFNEKCIAEFLQVTVNSIFRANNSLGNGSNKILVVLDILLNAIFYTFGQKILFVVLFYQSEWKKLHKSTFYVLISVFNFFCY